jgi:hypothetical protein
MAVEAGATRDTTGEVDLGRDSNNNFCSSWPRLGTSLKKEGAGDGYLYDSAVVAADMG